MEAMEKLTLQPVLSGGKHDDTGTCRIVRDDDCDHQGGENVDANLYQLQ